MAEDESTEWGYVCPDCQTNVDTETGQTYPVDKVRRNLNSEGTAESLAAAHRAKTGHEPEVKRFN